MTKGSNHCSTDEIFDIIVLDVITAKHGIIPTERETEEGGIMEDGTNKQKRALGGGKKKRIGTAVDDIEETVKISN